MGSSMNYSLNISKLVDDYLRPLFNLPKRVAWLNAVLSVVSQRHDAFLAFKQQMDAEVTITVQVNRFRQALRDKYNDQTIDIIHPGQYLDLTYIFLSTENAPAQYDFLAVEDHTPVEYDYLNGEFQAQVDYIVLIPATLLPQYNNILDYVNQYNLTSRRFAIQTAI
jgi:hypothetical protein